MRNKKGDTYTILYKSECIVFFMELTSTPFYHRAEVQGTDHMT